MDLSQDEHVSNLGSSETNSPLALFIMGFFQKVFSYFVMTEEEKVQAGIDWGETREIPDEENITIQDSPPEVVQESGRVA